MDGFTNHKLGGIAIIYQLRFNSTLSWLYFARSLEISAHSADSARYHSLYTVIKISVHSPCNVPTLDHGPSILIVQSSLKNFHSVFCGSGSETRLNQECVRLHGGRD